MSDERDVIAMPSDPQSPAMIEFTAAAKQLKIAEELVTTARARYVAAVKQLSDEVTR